MTNLTSERFGVSFSVDGPSICIKQGHKVTLQWPLEDLEELIAWLECQRVCDCEED